MDNLRDEAIRWAYDIYDDIMLDMPLFFGFEVMRCNFVIFYGVEYGIEMYCVHFLITSKF